jgi:Tfp pilus assembly protein PilF
MKTKKLVLVLNPVLAALALGACSSAPTMPDKAWKIEPVQSVRHSGSSAAGYHALGRYKEGQGAGEEAATAYRKALDADPGRAATWSALGALQALRGRIDEGLAALERAVSLAPAASHLHNNLGYALLLAGRDAAAVASLQRAVELDAGNRRAWTNLAIAYRRRGEPDKAALADARLGIGATPPLPRVPSAAAAGGPDAAASATAVTVSPLSMDVPALQRLPALEASASAAPVPAGPAHAGGNAGSPPAAAAPAAAEPGRGPMVVKLAENIFELRNGPALAADRDGGAAAIAVAAVTPPPPAATAVPLRTGNAPAGGIAATPGASGIADAGTRYEISNGHGGTGLARRLAALLGREGRARPRLTNRRPFDQPASFIEYREGYREAAESFAARLPFRPTIRAEAAASLSADVRLVLGRDLDTSDACGVLALCRRFARAEPPALAAAQAPRHGR